MDLSKKKKREREKGEREREKRETRLLLSETIPKGILLYSCALSPITIRSNYLIDLFSSTNKYQ